MCQPWTGSVYTTGLICVLYQLYTLAGPEHTIFWPRGCYEDHCARPQEARFNFRPYGRTLTPMVVQVRPQGRTLSPRGEVVPQGWTPSVRPSVLLNSREFFTPWGQLCPQGPTSPLGANFTPGGKLMLLKSGLFAFTTYLKIFCTLSNFCSHLLRFRCQSRITMNWMFVSIASSVFNNDKEFRLKNISWKPLLPPKNFQKLSRNGSVQLIRFFGINSGRGCLHFSGIETVPFCCDA
jgi:hypothetical protein